MNVRITSHEEFARRVASERARNSNYGVGAFLDRELTEPDRDGRRWLLLISDGDSFAWLEALVPRLVDAEIEDERVERAVERRAGGLLWDSRLRDLAAQSPLWLRADELFEASPPDAQHDSTEHSGCARALLYPRTR